MNIFGVGLIEVAVIFIVELLIIGLKRLPQLGKSISKTLKGFQSASNQFEKEITKSLQLNEVSE